MAESNDIGDIKVTKTSDDLENLLDSTELKQGDLLETKGDSKETNKAEVEDKVKQTLQANANTRQILERGSEELVSLGVGTRPKGFPEDTPPSMQSNRFKDKFHPPLEEHAGNVSMLLEELKGKISPEQYENYSKLLEIMRKINEEYRGMNESNSIEVKKQRLQRIGSYLQQLESLVDLQYSPESDNIICEDTSSSMQSTLQSLSKYVYPFMKEFVGSYSTWLEEHKDSLSSEQYDNHCNQLEVMRKLNEEYTAINESDSEEAKKLRLQRIVGYTQHMKSLGQFPPELDNHIVKYISSSMQSTMQSLSKDIYPRMREFVCTWLEEHKDSPSSEQYKNYCKQLEVIRKIVEEFEAKSESDSDEAKMQRFQRIVRYTKYMNSLGQSPPELDNVILKGTPPSMESIMDSFLYIDIPSAEFKESVEFYSMWFEEHKDGFSSEQYVDYYNRIETIKRVVEELEAKSESDSEEAKKQMFQRIVGNLQQMQSYLSMDFCFPNIKKAIGEYSTCLEDQKDSLSSEQYDDFCTRLKIMTKVDEEFEAENEPDSKEVKIQRRVRILDYVQQLLQLPTKLIILDSDADGATQAFPPGMGPNQCSTV